MNKIVVLKPSVPTGSLESSAPGGTE